MDNTGTSGSLNNDEFLKAILQYRNTPDTATGISPAMYIFHRPIRDFLPDINIRKPQENWNDVITSHQDARENHLTEHQTRLHEHTRRLPPLQVGDKVFIQNQIGSHPTKWENTGEITEVRQFDQYVVKMDSSGRPTLRNRKFLRIWNNASHQTHKPEVMPTAPTSMPDVTPTATPQMPNLSESRIAPEPEPTVITEPTANNERIQPEAPARSSHRIRKPPDRLQYPELGNPG